MVIRYCHGSITGKYSHTKCLYDRGFPICPDGGPGLILEENVYQ